LKIKKQQFEEQVNRTFYYDYLFKTLGQASFNGFFPADLDFMFDHINGCWLFVFDTYLDLNDDTVRNSKIPRGLIKAKKKPNPKIGNRWMWWVENREIVRSIDLVRNWVNTTTVAKTYSFNSKTFRRFAQQDKFGSHQKDIEGDIAIHKSVLTNIIEKYQQLASRYLEGYIPSRQNVISMRTFARRLNVAGHCLRPNLRRKEIDFESDGTAFLVTENAFMKFVQDVVDNKCDTSPKVAIECYKILKLSPDERTVLFQKRDRNKKSRSDQKP
jgi:hypothetical protein